MSLLTLIARRDFDYRHLLAYRLYESWLMGAQPCHKHIQPAFSTFVPKLARLPHFSRSRLDDYDFISRKYRDAYCIFLRITHTILA